MKKYLVMVFVSLSVLVFSGCFALRSAEGLNEGELNVNYIAPLAGSVRYGVTDNVETRFTIAGESNNYDLFIHTSADSSHVNYGLTLGTSTVLERKPFYYAGLTFGKKFNSYFSPYVSVTGMYDTERKKLRMSESYLSIGSETRITIFGTGISFLITPEISFAPSPRESDVYSGWIFAAMNIGVIFDVYSFFKK